VSVTPPFRTDIDFAYGVARDLAPGIARIVAENPGPFTYKGTNSYLIGTDSLILVDPGPGDEAHLAAILRAAAGRPITHIVITHTHRDHVDGLPAALAATGAKTAGYGAYPLPDPRPAARSGKGERVAPTFVPDIVLRDGDHLTAGGITLEAVHTPGHTPDHLCFAVSGTDVLLSGDHVMAWNTSVVAPPEGRMGDYLRSLEKLLTRTDAVYFPGHGGQLPDPQRIVRAYLVHRRMREQAILECIREGGHCIETIVAKIYKGLDETLIPAASLSVEAHVVHLAEQNLAHFPGPLDHATVLVGA
jgi:glyoxylase-like metal-dependent hydrolase (beta-lactamase superfamily II)